MPNEVNAGWIRATAKCCMGVTMPWAHFLVEEFMIDYFEAQEKGGHFHYLWLLILIALIGWQEPQDSRFVYTFPGGCEAGFYASLWHSSIPKRQQDTNVCFVVYNMNILMGISRLPRLTKEVAAKYNHIAAFKANMHQLFIQARFDPDRKWMPLSFQMEDKEFDKEIDDWEH